MDARTRNLTMYVLVKLGCLMLVRAAAVVALEEEIKRTEALLFAMIEGEEA